jgi:hypothetical protein
VIISVTIVSGLVDVKEDVLFWTDMLPLDFKPYLNDIKD